jgi:hypothetical protein
MAEDKGVKALMDSAMTFKFRDDQCYELVRTTPNIDGSGQS